MLAPIVVFAFNRPNALNNLLTSLKRNHLFEESKLFIFIDGCRNKNDMPQVNEVYAIARKFCNESKENRHIIISQQGPWYFDHYRGQYHYRKIWKSNSFRR